MDDEEESQARLPWRSGWKRILAAIGVALVMGVGCYWLIEATQPDGGLVSFAFLLVLPAVICALVCYIADPWASRPFRTYAMVPVWMLLGVIVIALFVLHEGVICILMLSPLWLVSGFSGAAVAYVSRHRVGTGRTYCFALLAAPLFAMQVEPMMPIPETRETVTRSIVIDAPPQRIWPLLRGITDVHPREGRWNFSQDLIGIPRPLSARLAGEGLGADRFAVWGHDIRFRERIIAWQPGRQIGWRFIFDDIDGWKFTDRHLMPDSAYFRVTDGGYVLERHGARGTRVTIATRYWIRTPVNGYSALWGELFLGDLENNLLAMIKRRAESGIEPGPSPAAPGSL